MHLIRQFFEQAGIAAEAADKIAAAFTRKSFSPGDCFLEEGKTCRHLAFIESGMFQHFIITDTGEERTIYVATANNFMASLLSYLNQKPSREYIRCIAESVIWIIDKPSIDQLRVTIPAFKDYYTGLLEYQISCIDNSRFDFITLNAEQRYAKMLAEEPHLIQQIPLQYLASMLGVTPRHLSRLRKKIA